MPRQLFETVKVSKVFDTVAAGTSTQTSSAISLMNTYSFIAIIHFGTITSTGVPAVSLQVSTDGSVFTDIADPSVSFTDADSGKVAIIEICNPLPTWTHVKVKVTRATANAIISSGLAIANGTFDHPSTHGTGVNYDVHIV